MTPYTSLMVLENVDQYVQYQIAPPQTLPTMLDEYKKRVDDRTDIRLAAGRCETVVTGLTPIVADNVAAYQPTVQMVQWGPALDVKIDLSDDGKSTAIELDAVLTEPSPTVSKPLNSTIGTHSTSRPSNQGNAVQDIDKLDFMLHTVHTSTRIPMGKPTLIGGITVAKGPKGKSVQLVLEVNVFKPAP